MIHPRSVLEQIRPLYLSPEAIIVTGMRRTGKTTLLNFINQEIGSKNTLFLDLENPLNRKFFEESNYEKVKRSLQFLGIDFDSRAYIFLDEIQLVKNLPSVIKYFVDHYQVKFFLTGSASFYLKNLFAESLAGRKYIFELFPLTFSEFLLFKGNNLRVPTEPGTVTRAVYDTLFPLYDEYISFGGFPQVVLKTSAEEKARVLEDIFSSYFQLEVVQWGDFRRNEVIRDLMLLLMQRVGSRLDIQKISRELGISRPTLNQYLSFLEGTYFIARVRPFSRGKDTEIRKMAKVYLCDTGLVNHFAKMDAGRLFENSVFQNLRNRGEIRYYQRKSGVEINFILNKKVAYGVKVNPDGKDFKKVGELAEELSLKEYRVFSGNFCESADAVYGFAF